MTAVRLARRKRTEVAATHSMNFSSGLNAAGSIFFSTF